MPIIEFHLMEGRTVEQKRQLCAAVTRSVVDTLGVRPEQVRILIHTLTPEHFSVGGITAADKAAQAAQQNE
ncbi:4-oxalocrotonate tautomerase [Lampropedia hyalina DSM 16112]|jgi:4-oxalocrotonate tautomerase|uniref:Tautomerase n=1 Tax=Lampropedia hyalina DSM 16112 TaxID=1122156 RepID=A0A1M4Y7Q4_9BURK|nr:2-hydroxymuconate tautomerase [Lampropedia hyalina]SHF01699.1 4-oxalocrotonate tautomerase [Lampropedia hyalina DSM 16112]